MLITKVCKKKISSQNINSKICKYGNVSSSKKWSGQTYVSLWLSKDTAILLYNSYAITPSI
jgi:hypothetical protein